MHIPHNTCTEPCAEIDVGLDSRGWCGFGSAACRQYAGETALAKQTETWLESLLPASSSVTERLQLFGRLIRCCQGAHFSFVAVEAFGATVSVAVPNKGLGGLDLFAFFENMLMFCFDFLELLARHTLG